MNTRIKPLNPSDKTLFLDYQERKILNGETLSKEQQEDLDRIKWIIQQTSDNVTELILNLDIWNR